MEAKKNTFEHRTPEEVRAWFYRAKARIAAREEEIRAMYKEKPQLSKEERKRGLMSLAGCWKDNPEDAAKMESAIKEGRKNEFTRDINLDD